MIEPSIYVADLSAYNAGVLHGSWIPLSGVDADDVNDAIAEILRSGAIACRGKTDGVHEEFAIHDYDGFGPIKIGEYDSVDSVLEHVDRMGDDPAKYFAYVDAHGSHYVDNFDADDVMGPYESEADIAWEMLDMTIGSTELSAWLRDKGMPEDLTYGIQFDTDAYLLAMRCNSGASIGSWDGVFYVC